MKKRVNPAPIQNFTNFMRFFLIKALIIVLYYMQNSNYGKA